MLDDGEIESLLTHPTGMVEMYVGRRDPAKPSVTLRTDGVLRSPAAKEYNAGSRMYGLVDSDLLWVMDMAAVGQSLQSHVSASSSASADFADLVAGMDRLGASVEPMDPQTRVRQVTDRAAARRGFNPPLEPDEVDIVDPFGRGDEVFATMAQQIVDSMPAAVRALAG